MKGTQTSLNVMIIISVLAAVIGMTVGAVAGYFRGGTDNVLMRFTDLFITFPVIVIGAVLGKLAGGAGAFCAGGGPRAASPGRRWPGSCAVSS